MIRTKKPAQAGERDYSIGSSVLGKWKITEFIGAGGFGKVFKIARSDGLISESSALKVITVPRNDGELRDLLDNGMSTAQARTYLEGMANDVVREISIMSKLKGSSNIVSYEDCEKVPHANGMGWDILIRMELLNPLLAYAYEHPFSRREIIKLGIDICRALELCQKYNIIHRDVKPENIFVSENGDFKLGDFGISRSFEQTAAASTRIGTGNYMAPEVFRGEKYGFSVDIYSLGIVLYRLLNKNRPPFYPPAPQGILPSDQEAAFAKRIAGEPVPPPYYSQGRLPEIVLKACAPAAKDRYSSPAQMRQELEAILYDQEDAAYIYPDGDTLENLREYYASQKRPSPGRGDGGNRSKASKAPEVPMAGTGTELVEPEESGPPKEPVKAPVKWDKKLIGIVTAACMCVLVAAVGLFFLLRGGDAPAPGDTAAVAPESSQPLTPPQSASPLTDFTIENGVLVKYIGSGGDVVIPDSVTGIGEYAFNECKDVTSVTIPNSVTSIADAAFQGCRGLTNVTIPESVTSIGGWAFNQCTGLTSIIIPNGVTSIGGYTFCLCESLTSVVIPDNVTSIGSWAFYGCASLTSMTIPDGVTVIEPNTFGGCWALTDVYYAGTQAQWEAVASGNSNGPLFYATIHCAGDGQTLTGTQQVQQSASPLTDFTIEDGVLVEYIGAGGDVVIPDSVTSIGNFAFSHCKDLTSVVIPSSVTSIGQSSFFGAGLASVTIPGTVAEIGPSAFGYCDNLVSATISDGVTKIGDSVFSNCEALTDVTIPASVTSLGAGVFEGCKSLPGVTIPQGVTDTIKGLMFCDCMGLTSMTIPEGVTKIDTGAFAHCTSMASITIPSTVTSIKWQGFVNCPSLTDIYYAGTRAQWDAIEIGEDNLPLQNAAVHCAEG